MTQDPVRNLGRWLWYLLPANPIIVRVVQGSSRRTRHLWYRFAYLLVLFLVLLFTSIARGQENALSDLAKGSTQVFQFIATTQLLMMSFLAPVFTAAAITQEKDAETYNVLLTTPLSSAQIILGSLLSRLFFVITLLLAGFPIFSITMLYGGVTMNQIMLSFAIAGCTALITGSLAIMISVAKVGTRRTIFSFFLLIGLYLMLGYVLGRWSATALPEAPDSADGRRMSWLTAFHPFLALEVGLSQVQVPPLADVAHYGSPMKYLFAAPHVSYCVMTALASLALVMFSMAFVRRGVKEGEITAWTRLTSRFSRGGPDGDQRRDPRRVWGNPVAWREATTRASAASAGLTRWVLIIGGLIAAVWVLYYLVTGQSVEWKGTAVPFGVEHARAVLRALISIEFALIILVVTNASATSMTKEDEANTMDILMSTPLTSHAIIWGKLRGLVSFAIPMLIVPIASLLLFAVYGLISSRGAGVVSPETVFELAIMMLIYTAVAAVVGMQTSIKSKRTVQALVVSITAMTALCGISYLIGDAIVEGAGEVGAALAPFTPFTGVKMMTNPQSYGVPINGSTRVMMAVGTVLAALSWGGIAVFGMYKSLVNNFYMTIRRKTAS
jgi:ABC-type transport system involved in multi-copper enzyme maturation permease subunit